MRTMSEISYGEKLKFELAALKLSTDENLEMVGRCHLAIKVFGDPSVVGPGSVVFGFPSDRKRFTAPLRPEQAALNIYEYLLRYKQVEQGQMPVGHVPKPVDMDGPRPVEGWADSKRRYEKLRSEKAEEPPRRVFAMPSSEIRAEAKDIADFRLEDFKEGAWVVTAKAELKLACDLEVVDLPPEQIGQLRALSRKLRELEAAL